MFFTKDTDLKSWSLTFGKSLMSMPILTVVRVLFGREFLERIDAVSACIHGL